MSEKKEMPLYANFNSPQFVDFLNNDTFDINDGADVLFDEYCVGEGNAARRVRSDEGTELSNRFLADFNREMLMKPTRDVPSKPTRPNATPFGGNKENLSSSSQKPPVLVPKAKQEIVGTTAPSIGSALDMMAASANRPVARTTPVLKAEKDMTNNPVVQQPVIVSNYPKQRTMSSSVVMSTPLLISKPSSHAPAHNGVAWIPKMGAMRGGGGGETKTPPTSQMTTTKPPMMLPTPVAVPVANPTRPVIAGSSHDEQAKKPLTASSLTRSTPGKSASMRGNDRKPTNLIKQLLAKPKVAMSSKPPMPHNHDSHSHKSAISTPKTASSSAHNTSASINTSSSHVRKMSESKIPVGGGMLHTELRAQKRHEFDAIMREKERQAAEQRLLYEHEKQRQEQEMVNQLRSKLNFKSQPIRHYRQVEIKPSERALTSPVSPHIGGSSALPHKNESHVEAKKPPSPLVHANATSQHEHPFGGF